jgi:hypothetical protein
LSTETTQPIEGSREAAIESARAASFGANPADAVIYTNKQTGRRWYGWNARTIRPGAHLGVDVIATFCRGRRLDDAPPSAEVGHTIDGVRCDDGAERLHPADESVNANQLAWSQTDEARRYYRADGTYELLATAEEVIARRIGAAKANAELLAVLHSAELGLVTALANLPMFTAPGAMDTVLAAHKRVLATLANHAKPAPDESRIPPPAAIDARAIREGTSRSVAEERTRRGAEDAPSESLDTLMRRASRVASPIGFRLIAEKAESGMRIVYTSDAVIRDAIEPIAFDQSAVDGRMGGAASACGGDEDNGNTLRITGQLTPNVANTLGQVIAAAVSKGCHVIVDVTAADPAA